MLSVADTITGSSKPCPQHKRFVAMERAADMPEAAAEARPRRSQKASKGPKEKAKLRHLGGLQHGLHDESRRPILLTKRILRIMQADAQAAGYAMSEAASKPNPDHCAKHSPSFVASWQSWSSAFRWFFFLLPVQRSRSSCGGRKMRGDREARPSFRGCKETGRVSEFLFACCSLSFRRRSFRLRTVSRPRNPSKTT